jgi:hypothetical protein
MSNNKDYERDKEETLPAETTSDDPSRPTGKTTTSLRTEDEPTLPAETPLNIKTKAAHKKRWSWFHRRQPRNPVMMNPFRLESKRLDGHSKIK